MTAVTLLAAVLTIVVAATCMAVLSAAEASVGFLTRTRTRRLIESERRGAESLDRLVERPSRLASACAIWRGVAYSLGAATLGWAGARILESGPTWPVVFGGAGVGAFVIFALGEALPRTLAVHNPERVGLAAAPPAARLTAVLSPLARLLGAGWIWLVGLVAEETVPDAWVTGDEYRSDTVPEEEMSREEAEEAFFDAVVEFGTKIVREVMVPRTDMECLEDTASVAAALETVGRSGYSRLPVYHETLDDIRGVLYAKDLLICVGSGGCPETVGPIVREAYFVPETKPVEELLVEMRQRKTHIALVADEYGGTAGLVTIEDLLEEIVGEIFDEYDRAEPMVVALEDGALLVDGRLPVDDFNDLVGTDIDLEADSIGGLFVELAGHIPQAGETLEVEGVLLTVQEVEGTRIRRLVVQPGGESEKEAEDAEAHNAG